MIDTKAVCDGGTLCLTIGGATISPSTVVTFVMALPAFIWFSWQLVDKWRANRVPFYKE